MIMYMYKEIIMIIKYSANLQGNLINQHTILKAMFTIGIQPSIVFINPIIDESESIAGDAWTSVVIKCWCTIICVNAINDTFSIIVFHYDGPTIHPMVGVTTVSKNEVP